MHRHVEKAQSESLVEEIFAQFDSRACTQRIAGADWENSLTDFEWIDFWASLYSSEMMNTADQRGVKQ